MKGLSQSANQIISEFSSIELLKDYQLVGGTAIAIQIEHRLSDDLDFCKWVPDTNKPQHAVDPNALEKELTQRFGKVERNHLGFAQVNFFIENPGVKITYYHTDLPRPDESPNHIIGNIHAANIKVLGGSKLYLINKRTEIRDFYDIYVLLKKGIVGLNEMMTKMNSIDKKVTPQNIYTISSKVQFSDKAIEKDLNYLEPRYPVTAKELREFYKNLSIEIENTYLKKK